YWNNASFHHYADYALSSAFQDGLAQLRRLGRKHTVATMCAEAVWWRCHRRIIADYLLARVEDVLHLMGGGRANAASLTPAAHIDGDSIFYPPTPSEETAT